MFLGTLLKNFLTTKLIVTRENKSSQFIRAKLESLNLPYLIYFKKITFFTDHQISPKNINILTKEKVAPNSLRHFFVKLCIAAD